MLRFEVENKFLDLGDSSFNFQLINPAFTKTGFKKAFTFSVNVPNTPNNNNILNYSYRIDTTIINDRIDCIVYLGSNPFLYGYLIITNCTDKVYELSFKEYTTDLLNDLSKIQITDLLNESVRIVQTPASYTLKLLQAPSIFPANQKIGLMINNVIYSYNTINGQTSEEALRGLANLINQDHIGAALGYKITGNTIVLEQPLSSNNFSLFYEGYTNYHYYDWELQQQTSQLNTHLTDYKIFLQNIINTPIQDLKFAFPRIYNNSFYESNGDFSRYINYYSSEYLLNNDGHDAGQWKNTIIPYVSIRYIMTRLFQSLNYTLDTTFFDTLFLHHNKSIDNQIKDLDKYYNIFRSTFRLSEFVPKISALKFLESLVNSFQIMFVYKTGKFTVRHKKDIFNKVAQDYTHQLTNEYKITNTIDKGLKITIKDDGENQTDQHPDFIIGQGEKTVEIIPTLYNGAINITKDTENKLRIIKYEHQGYPIASSYTTPEQIYNENKNWFDLISKNKNISLIMRLTSSDLRNIQFFENPMITIQLPQGFIYGVIKSIAFKANSKGISSSTIHILQMP